MEDYIEMKVCFELPKILTIEWPSPWMEDFGFVSNPKNIPAIAMDEGAKDE